MKRVRRMSRKYRVRKIGEGVIEITIRMPYQIYNALEKKAYENKIKIEDLLLRAILKVLGN